MTTDNFCFYLLNSLIQTSQTGGQWYSDTSPFSIPWPLRFLWLLGQVRFSGFFSISFAHLLELRHEKGPTDRVDGPSPLTPEAGWAKVLGYLRLCVTKSNCSEFGRTYVELGYLQTHLCSSCISSAVPVRPSIKLSLCSKKVCLA